MNRPAVRLIVFTGLLALAGAVWGVLGCALYTGGIALPDQPLSSVSVTVPIAFLTLLAAVWLAALQIASDARKALTQMMMLHYCLNVVLFSATLICMLAGISRNINPTIALGTLIGFLLLSLTVQLISYRMARKQKKAAQNAPRQPFPKAYFAMVGVAIVAIMLAHSLLVPEETDLDKTTKMLSLGGLSPLGALAFFGVGFVDMQRWLWYSAVMGGIYGVLVGLFLTPPDHPDPIRAVIRRATTGMLICAGLSAMLFLVHASLLLYTYDVAWNEDAFRAVALPVWAGVGAFMGLVLAGVVHVASAAPEKRLERVPLALAVTVPIALAACTWMWQYIERKDAGRALIAEAARLEGEAFAVGFGLGDADKPVYLGGMRQVIVHGPSSATAYRERACHDRTITACDEVLARYPGSAFRSAALFLKADACHHTWRAKEAISAEQLLRKEFPRHRYDWGDLRVMYHLANLTLIGDDEAALDSAKRAAQKNPRNSRLGVRVLAAERLGRWDEAVEARKALLASRIENKPKYPSADSLQSLDRARARLRHAESMLANKAGAPPTTDVRGRVRLNAQPLAGTVVCLIPSDRVQEDDRTISAYSAGMRGGRIARTDAGGRFAISGLISGEYAVMVVADPNLVPKTVTVAAPGVPYRVTGKRVALPEIRLTAPLSR